MGDKDEFLQTNQRFDEFFSNLDTDRIMFLRSYVTQLQRATVDGVPVNGCFQWSMMDNFEWTAGFGQPLVSGGRSEVVCARQRQLRVLRQQSAQRLERGGGAGDPAESAEEVSQRPVITRYEELRGRTMKSILRAALAIVAVPLLLFASSVSAEETLPDRFMIRGGYLMVFGAETDVQRVGQAGFGTVIDFNKTLHGTQDYTGYRFDAAFRFNERHSMGLSYYRVLRNANRASRSI